MLRCNDLHYAYPDGRGISAIDLAIARPGLVALIGRNGSGKTTLLNVLSGRLAPSGGNLRLFGRLIDPAGDVAWKARLAYCPSDDLLIGMLTVRENYELIGWLRCGDKQAWRAIGHQIEAFGCGPYLGLPAAELSAGQLRRCMILSLLIGRAELVLLDEPGNDLDIEGIFLLRDLLAELARERLVLVSTHIIDVVRRLELRALFMEAGRLVYDGQLSGDGLAAGHQLEDLYRSLVWDKSAGPVAADRG
ncbi:MAG: hypothetical protein A2087_00340 [Spirochaetes bacterium GWD1_61_31]|nr:MAG: hypothetical protein A2Y37_00490 [Spirochaetes bacterium GWB1_60_80]OHD35513.1 MAG: hypothetical protein A2004_01195 [Spirochaetes bacterium GWC1_61_12]OHD39004.1 MAG: hypothetical protein A2087_00340 [Spirochaetes bacterium GWD1_61_31]OHD43503.1 MAG: hypothetical protein A2Y35_14940 [Spirochaetes bacterium GWE1_60_18]OHD60766.1 MAG: hypothetical protein A2Y32_07840 [Spirochaetes bacterium GWF1_60_12]HAP44598.1 hypothetical protein [Spirochaetaceae bacterium]